MPKQFLSLTGDGQTMIQITVKRISAVVEIEDIFIVTNQDYWSLVKEQLPEIPEKNRYSSVSKYFFAVFKSGFSTKQSTKKARCTHWFGLNLI